MKLCGTVREDPKYTKIVHEYDLWHLAKNIGKRLREAARNKNYV